MTMTIFSIMMNTIEIRSNVMFVEKNWNMRKRMEDK